jgi:hypothetical protein
MSAQFIKIASCKYVPANTRNVLISIVISSLWIISDFWYSSCREYGQTTLLPAVLPTANDDLLDFS